MDAAPKSALGDATNAPQQPAAKPRPRPAADKPPRAVVTWYHPDHLPPPPAVASESEEEEEEEENLNADLERKCAAAICWRGGTVLPDDVVLVCETCCAPNDTFHAKCVCVDPAKMPAGWDGKWWCGECEAVKKAEAVAAEKAELKKDGDLDYEEEAGVATTKRRAAPKKRAAAPPPMSRGHWSEAEHAKFVAALAVHGRDWVKVAYAVGSRTLAQVRSHAQKHFLKHRRPPARKRQPKKRGPPPVVLELDDGEEVEPAPKKKKSLLLARLAQALRRGSQRSTLVLRCLGEHDPRWDGVTRPSSMAWVPEVGLGYPEGTHEKPVGRGMFLRATPSAEGIYTFPKINYKPIKPGQRQKKTGEVVHYRLVEESDVEAIKEKLGLDF